MTMQEIVEQVSFLLGLPANRNVEGQQVEQAVNIAFRELKRYIDTPVDKTVSYSTRIDLVAVDIITVKILDVLPAYPALGLNLASMNSGNVFQLAAAVNTFGALGNTSNVYTDRIMSELSLAQVRNTLSTDFQWRYDLPNQVVYCTHRSPIPTSVTIRYVPDFKDVSEIHNHTWEDYLVRLSEAYMKKSLGRTRSKYTIEGSNVSLDGDQLLSEANAEIEAIHNELLNKQSKLVVLN